MLDGSSVLAQGETDSSLIAVASVNDRGEATGVSTSSAVSRSEMEPNSTSAYRIGIYERVVISLNWDKIEKMAVSEGIREVESWVGAINDELVREMLKVGLRVALQFEKTQRRMQIRMFTNLLNLFNFAPPILSIHFFILGFILQNVLIPRHVNSLDFSTSGGSAGSIENRFSLLNVCGAELDRALAFFIMANMRSLVREIVPIDGAACRI